MTKFRLVFNLLILLSLTMSLYAQPDTLWTSRYGGSGSEVFNSGEQTADGGFIFLGDSDTLGLGNTDMWMVKTNGAGGTLWSRRYGGEFMENGNDVHQAADGGYILAGVSISYGTAGDADGYVVKTDDAGNVEWTYNSGLLNFDAFSSITQTSDGGYAAAGVFLDDNFNGGVLVAKLSSAGVFLWMYAVSVADSNRSLADIEETFDGGLVCSGRSGSEALLLKLDGSGNLVLSEVFTGHDFTFGEAVRQTSDGGYVIAGSSYDIALDHFDMYLLKTTASGAEQWHSFFGGDLPGALGYDVAILADGGYAVAGAVGDAPLGFGGTDAWLVGVSTGGVQNWDKIIGNSQNQEARSVKRNSDDGLILAGFITNSGEDLDGYGIRTLAANSSPLPVELSAFNAVPTQEGIQIRFSTSSEQNVSHFEIMRRQSNQETFEKIAELNSQGNASTEQNYVYLDNRVLSHVSYDYYLASVDLNGAREEFRGMMRQASFGSEIVPQSFALSAYPNPFNPQTMLTFSIPTSGKTSLKIYTTTGQLQEVLTDEFLEAGEHRISFNGSALPSGVYFARLESQTLQAVTKLILMK